jgi:hypothetical protein
MKEDLRSHLNLLFENAPKTRRAFELKEELFTNSAERYEDLVSNGVSPEDAYKNVINSIGNVSELFKGLDEMSTEEIKQEDEKIKKLALVKTIAIGLYIFSFAAFLWFALIRHPFMHWADMTVTGIIIMILIDIIPTCMLVYVSSAYPKYRRLNDTVVEDFKAWQSETQKIKALRGATYILLWTMTLLLYFAVSFSTRAWNISWVVFLAGVCVNAAIELIFRLKEIKK